MTRIAFLASGQGGTLKAVHLAIEHLGLALSIAEVIADRECGAIEFGRGVQIPNRVIPYDKTDDSALRNAVRGLNADILVTTFNRILSPRVLEAARGELVNLHYSLLPAFGGMIGMKTLEAARQRGVQWIGATCHTVTPSVDAGPILAQCVLAPRWEHEPIAQTQDIVFRAACLTLLGVLLARAGGVHPATESTTEIAGRPVHFSPGLAFDPGALDEQYWESVRK